MSRIIIAFGLVAGLIIVVPMFTLLFISDPGSLGHAEIIGFSFMFLGFSLIFVGVKRFRDRALGGVIRFVPAFLLGLGISAVATLVYIVSWEITLALTNYAFLETYPAQAIEAARAKGKSSAEIAKLTADMQSMMTWYRNPFLRMPMTTIEIFPVGLLVSLVSAGLLRNSRFLPMKVVQG